MTFTAEQMNKAKSAKSAEELLAMAKESGVEMTEAQAAKYFDELHKEGELTDDELAAVAGGNPKGSIHTDTGWFDKGDIVQDSLGVQYEVQGYDSTVYGNSGEARTVWFRTTVIYVPESAKANTTYREGDTYFVNSGMVSCVK